MSIPTPVPLYPTLEEIHELNLSEYPTVCEFLNHGQSWRKQHWSWGLEFLKYVGRNKSEHTYARFRSETERFLLWVFLVKECPMDTLRIWTCERSALHSRRWFRCATCSCSGTSGQQAKRVSFSYRDTEF